jgi:mono/diheme cytochrome c family protein
MRSFFLSLFVCAHAFAASPGAISQPNLTEGKKTFEQSCSPCHGAKGEGAFGPSLHRPLTHGNERSQIAKVITHGVPGTAMPASKFPAPKLNSLVEYVRSLNR